MSVPIVRISKSIAQGASCPAPAVIGRHFQFADETVKLTLIFTGNAVASSLASGDKQR
jgi:hypothetical protein